MRGADEASLIGVRDKIVVENNYGHTVGFPVAQLVSNEPGMELITVDPCQPGEVVRNNSYTTFFGMSQLARESGIIFAFSGSWFDTISSTQGAEYSVVAMDSFSFGVFPSDVEVTTVMSMVGSTLIVVERILLLGAMDILLL